ncbi:hypothetical protein NDU88_003685 [Pleurodeles waltl]|uniref:Uncharacterized protein n=1 Tax=Pleurodeles waltl TaxID=8319 RepID=A0AAV7RIX6_PLEWA|nr:hypothetical protein NDU88_003685 [Pleurodeles waltl]
MPSAFHKVPLPLRALHHPGPPTLVPFRKSFRRPAQPSIKEQIGRGASHSERGRLPGHITLGTDRRRCTAQTDPAHLSTGFLLSCPCKEGTSRKGGLVLQPTSHLRSIHVVVIREGQRDEDQAVLGSGYSMCSSAAGFHRGRS